MDQSLLVRNGHLLLDELDRTKFRPTAALWFHDPEADSWRLWIVPDVAKPDKHEFYRTISTVLTQAGSDIDISPSVVRMMDAKHPAIDALTRMFHIEGKSNVSVSNNMLNGFFMPDGVILRMIRAVPRTTAA